MYSKKTSRPICCLSRVKFVSHKLTNDGSKASAVYGGWLVN